MLSINTNLSSLIAQNSMKTSTNKLDQAIERMTTGFKINHAKDNAANYSISTNMTTQLSAYDVAADNVAMGMDMVNTASDIISQMQDKGERLRALATQARNGTYGGKSLEALNSEAGALIQEIRRLYETSEYNGIQIFNRKEYEISDKMPKAKEEYGGFIVDPKTYSDEYVESLTSISKVEDSFDESIYKILSAEDLAHLAELVNNGVTTAGVTFVLGADIDLKDYDNWAPIGNDSYQFAGIFDGNGHFIKNLTVKTTTNCQGLFGRTSNGSVVKNVALKNSNVLPNGKVYIASLIGRSSSEVYNCYAVGTVIGGDNVGGLVGTSTGNGSVDSCYFLGIVKSTSNAIGGLVGQSHTLVKNSYASANIYGRGNVGGLIGDCRALLENCYSKSSVGFNAEMTPINYCLGGLVGSVFMPTTSLTFKDCFSFSDVDMTYDTGSFLGAIVNSTDGINFMTLNLVNCGSKEQDVDLVGRILKYSGGTQLVMDYDITTITDNIKILLENQTSIELQVGIFNNRSCCIDFDMNLEYSLAALKGRIDTEEAFSVIDNFVSLLSEKSTMLGAVQNRLDSALESIQVNIDNLTSSRSTIRDADIAEVSSQYIQQQILQQASATLMATANQSPSIALQLI